LVNFARKIVLIGGTRYAGEIKKSVFTIMNYLMPLRGVLPMHCSANVGADGDVAIFFGLSGPARRRFRPIRTGRSIGDDEHGWSADGVFNFEGGCYAKVIKLSQAAEPEIWAASHRFGTCSRTSSSTSDARARSDSSKLKTENTRSAYPVDFIPQHRPRQMKGGTSATIIMLTADAFGVLPPIAKLTPSRRCITSSRATRRRSPAPRRA
jgi:phosphoenolpyruvate carboxykinase (ATP)